MILSNHMIEVINLSKNYGTFKALDDISFSIKKGEIIGLLGPNGAGKTTTMKILTCYLAASSGKILVDGLDISEHSIETRRKIGYLPENAPLYEDMTVWEYLDFSGAVLGLGGEAKRGKIDEVVASCSLGDKKHELITHLSKGYRQRVGLARVLLGDPEILVLDEPTVGLDPNQIVEIRELIKKIGRSKTVILSSHILSEVEATCDRVLIIKGGHIIATGTPEELRASKGGQSRIMIVLEDISGRDPVSALGGVPGVTGVEKIKSHETGVVICSVICEGGKDLRKPLIAFLRDHGFVLLELSRTQLSLEDIFVQFTK
ncbi:MAG: antibiotic transport system ATP-binding protein [Parcubacteria group bacterium Gr01-1014_18]|nr:MAG: antibiotic transport system ATP-binding protein [Parcubacteria group bacterium Greene0416_36]TSC80948.1 MAG: antibiotic transport system ATP-binding protein [Parcubacteria group bacterium Gr01-1014_18]TSC98709.1 MAG: antibiotic transport system ATP-binding protein [Parcubacteria group bacterium Greene1014_20]TSD06461.1 MAG: antibiotic transport system ATP-binding protein [Parcubacteria group bacterium Greene0714_2]